MILLLATFFVLGYCAIVIEHIIKINKAAIALITGICCWTIPVFFEAGDFHISEALAEHISEIAGILFFLMGAMTVVELIDAHNGFEVITDNIQTRNKRKLLWLVSCITFVLSALLDNLTTTIVMVTLIRKLVPDKNERLIFAGLVIIAANAGGAWSPIGDVTTTMLWIGGQITSIHIIKSLILPSLVCMLVPLAVASLQFKGEFPAIFETESMKRDKLHKGERNIMFYSGISMLIFVPIFKTITHLPPYMGMLFGLAILWLLSELVHRDKDEIDKSHLSVLHSLRKIDMASILFFLGILLAVSALQTTGILNMLAEQVTQATGNINLILISVGLLSAIIDNVPLVAGMMGMYDLTMYPTDHYFWEFLAYTSGTGGSILIIGSAAGVAAMGMVKIDFFWYLKKIGWLALIGYLCGALVYMYL